MENNYLVIHYLMDDDEVVLFKLSDDINTAVSSAKKKWREEIQKGKDAGDKFDMNQTWWDDSDGYGQVAYADGTRTTYDIVDCIGLI